MNEKVENMLKEMKNTRTQSVPSRRYQEENTPPVGTSKNTNNKDDEANAFEPENQENEIQDNSIRPSNMNELRTQMQPLNIQNINFNDSVVINEDRTEEQYHMVTGAIKPLHCQSSNNTTTTTRNEHLIAELSKFSKTSLTK